MTGWIVAGLLVAAFVVVVFFIWRSYRKDMRW